MNTSVVIKNHRGHVISFDLIKGYLQDKIKSFIGED